MPASGDGYSVTFAPLAINFNFENCKNSANVYSGSRAAIFLSKVSHTIQISEFSIHFTNCSNSGNVYTNTDEFAGIVSGYLNPNVINNIGTYLEGLSNTGTRTVKYNSSPQEYTGDSALVYVKV